MSLTDWNTNWVLGSYYADRDYFIKSVENIYLIRDQNSSYLKPYYDGSMAIGYGYDLLVHNNAEIDQFFATAGLPMRLSESDKVLLDAAREYRRANKEKRLSDSDLKVALTSIADQLSLDLGSSDYATGEANATALVDTYMDKFAEPQVTSFLNRWGCSNWVDSHERIALISLA